MNISYLGGGEGRARALWGCLLYLMWKLLLWFWSWGNRGTCCENVGYLIWHLWYTLDSFCRHGAAVNRFDCGALPWWRSAGILVLLTKTRLFLPPLSSLFFSACEGTAFFLPPHWIIRVWKETAACESRSVSEGASRQHGIVIIFWTRNARTLPGFTFPPGSHWICASLSHSELWVCLLAQSFIFIR